MEGYNDTNLKSELRAYNSSSHIGVPKNLSSTIS